MPVGARRARVDAWGVTRASRGGKRPGWWRVRYPGHRSPMTDRLTATKVAEPACLVPWAAGGRLTLEIGGAGDLIKMGRLTMITHGTGVVELGGVGVAASSWASSTAGAPPCPNPS